MALPDKRTSGTRTSKVTASQQPAAIPDKNTSRGHASPMHAERLRNLYAAMLKCRALGDVLRAQLEDQRCGRGFEAIVAGAAIHLKPDDLIAPSTGELFARSVQGAPLNTVAASMKLEEEHAGCGALRLNSPPASRAMDVATGMALACKSQNNGLVTLCITADNDASQWGAVSFAATRKLPLVFVIAYDSSSASTPVVMRTEAQESLPVITVDGSDVVAVYRVAEECMRRARQGLGPSLIGCPMYTERDPILFMENYLRERQLWSEDWKQKLARDFRLQAELVAKKCLDPNTVKPKVRIPSR